MALGGSLMKTNSVSSLIPSSPHLSIALPSPRSLSYCAQTCRCFFPMDPPDPGALHSASASKQAHEDQKSAVLNGAQATRQNWIWRGSAHRLVDSGLQLIWSVFIFPWRCLQMVLFHLKATCKTQRDSVHHKVTHYRFHLLDKNHLVSKQLQIIFVLFWVLK